MKSIISVYIEAPSDVSVIQIILGSSVVVELEKRDESQAALPTKDINDYVLALRLTRWPKYVFDCIKSHLSEVSFQQIQGR